MAKKKTVNTLEEFEKFLGMKNLGINDIINSAHVKGILYVDWWDTLSIIDNVSNQLNGELIGVKTPITQMEK